VNLTEPIRRVARQRPHDPAVVDGERTTTYRDLWSAVSQVAAGLRRRGLAPGGPGGRVMLWLGDGAGFLAAHFGVMAGGLLSIPVKAENGPAELAAIAADSRPALLIAERERVGRLPERLPPELPWLPADEILPGEAPPAAADMTPEDVPDDHPASVIYSYVFGEGRSYGAVLTHGNHHFTGHASCAFFGVEPGDHVLVPLPMLHVFSMGRAILPALYQAGTVFSGDPLRPRSILETITRHRIHHIPIVPQPLVQLARSFRPDRHDLSSIRNITCGADFLPAEVHRQLQAALGVTIIQGYGMTETFPTVSSPPDERNRPGTLGLAFHPAIRYRILDPDGRELGPDEPGEIDMSCPGGMAGYLDAPAATARLKRDGWIRSGDRGWIDRDGYLCFDRMIKPIVNLAGNKVDPIEVARVIERLPGVGAARVFGATVTPAAAPAAGAAGAAAAAPGGVADPGAAATLAASALPEIALHAAVELEAGAALTERDLRVHCRRWLAPYKVPQRVELS
jgi:acyl-CoA synthetase (AMP-forming)/AMP-acid ligase II